MGPKVVDLLLEENLISEYADIFTLERGDLLALPRFAEKSVDNILSAIEKSRRVTLARFLVGLSIPQVGEETALDLSRHFKNLEKLRGASFEKLEVLSGVGPIIAKSVVDFFASEENKKIVANLLAEIKVEKEKEIKSNVLFGKKFVVTGTLSKMSRDEVKDLIRDNGGEVSENVSKETSFLVAGENAGSKYEKAQELGVPILSEEEFLVML